jgi:hypothetical protein
MTKSSASLLVWGPRILGILVCLFLSVFALDAFGGGTTFIQALPEFAVHIAPMLVLLGVVCVSWRWEWVGAIVFTSLAVGYLFFARGHVSWTLVIAGPLFLVGLLFFWSWFHHDELRRGGQTRRFLTARAGTRPGPLSPGR